MPDIGEKLMVQGLVPSIAGESIASEAAQCSFMVPHPVIGL